MILYLVAQFSMVFSHYLIYKTRKCGGKTYQIKQVYIELFPFRVPIFYNSLLWYEYFHDRLDIVNKK